MPSGKVAVNRFVIFSELGWIALATSGNKLIQLSFGRRSPQAAMQSLTIGDGDRRDGEPDDFTTQLAQRLQAYVSGTRDDFRDVALDLSALTGFQRRVVHHCRRIPYGRTLSYGQLAAKVGSPHAARAVGNVMASNRYALIVPCHRVVGAGGALGGYSAPDGLQLKRRLLEMEGSLGPEEAAYSSCSISGHSDGAGSR